jgi:hypothetical protein
MGVYTAMMTDTCLIMTRTPSQKDINMIFHRKKDLNVTNTSQSGPGKKLSLEGTTGTFCSREGKKPRWRNINLGRRILP